MTSLAIPSQVFFLRFPFCTSILRQMLPERQWVNSLITHPILYSYSLPYIFEIPPGEQAEYISLTLKFG